MGPKKLPFVSGHHCNIPAKFERCSSFLSEVMYSRNLRQHIAKIPTWDGRYQNTDLCCSVRKSLFYLYEALGFNLVVKAEYIYELKFADESSGALGLL